MKTETINCGGGKVEHNAWLEAQKPIDLKIAESHARIKTLKNNLDSALQAYMKASDALMAEQLAMLELLKQK